MEVAQEITVAAATGHDYSVWGLLLQADPVVKAVILLLVVASVACWAITFEKIVRVSWLKASIRRLSQTRSSRGRGGLTGAVLSAGEAELAADLDDSPTERRFRVENAMRHTFKSQIQKVEGGLPFLATTGSAAPFIGLFGTVWGIVNSFTAIAQQKDTSLAVVAPGIAEALIVTAIGLAAAIPAVVAYNQISVALGRAYAKGNDAIIEIARDIAGGEAEAQVKPLPADNVEPLRAGKPS
ncbi:MAG: MotA/TolQ/ExbB proton channel family protein [Pseudomonadota bacterium]